MVDLPTRPQDVPRCEKCGAALAKRRPGKIVLILKTRYVAFGADGDAEMTCPECHQDAKVPRRWFIVGPAPA